MGLAHILVIRVEVELLARRGERGRAFPYPCVRTPYDKQRCGVIPGLRFCDGVRGKAAESMADGSPRMSAFIRSKVARGLVRSDMFNNAPCGTKAVNQMTNHSSLERTGVAIVEQEWGFAWRDAEIADLLR